MNDRKYKTIKHQHIVGDLHELTFSCYRKMHLLSNDTWRELLSRRVEIACSEQSFELVAFVYMPDHVHLLVFPTLPEPDLGNFLAAIKQPFSSSIRSILEHTRSPLFQRLTIRERPGKNVFRFWQEGPGYDRNLFQPESIEASLNYIHNNPVRKKLCERAVEWKWSSARYYYAEPPRQQLAELPHIHGLRPESLDAGSSRH